MWEVALLDESVRELRRLRLTRGRSRRTERRIRQAAAALVAAMALLGAAQVARADSTPNFAASSANPFALADVGLYAAPDFADIDGDGDLDALIGNSAGSTYFLRNTGTATAPAFAAPSTNPYALADVGLYAAPDFADIDGDGDLDAFVGEVFGNTIFFRNTGTATSPAFAASSVNPLALADVGSFAAPAFVDIDHDGDLDAFIGNSAGNTIFFLNTGTATAPAFAAPSTNPYALAGVGLFASPDFVDIDDDGDLDAFVGEVNGNTIFFLNTGTATAPAFAAPSTNPYALAGVGVYAAPDFADIDGDGDLDAFIGERYGRTIFFRNDATDCGHTFQSTSTNPFALADVDLYASPDFVDIDGDGDLDALIGEYLGNTIFFRNTGTATSPAFAASSVNPFALADVGFLASPDFADLDGDGDLDALIGNDAGNTIFFRNTGTATVPAFAAPSTNPFALADVGQRAAPAFADIDGDGDLDALVGNYDGNTIFFRNTGTATLPAFAASSTNPFALADVGSKVSPDFADIDGDGDLDALIGEFDGNTIFFRNTGTATAPAFAAPSTNPFALADVGTSASPDFADIDGDGDLDAFVGELNGNTIFFPAACPPPVNTPTSTPTNTSTATETPTSTPTSSSTSTSTPSDTPTSTPSNTGTATETPTSTATETPTSTPSNTPTSTPSETPTSTPSNTPTSTPTETPTSTPSNTPTSTPTETPTSTTTSTDTPTSTATSTPTPVSVAITSGAAVGSEMLQGFGPPNEPDGCIQVCENGADNVFGGCSAPGDEPLGSGGTDASGRFQQGGSPGIALNRELVNGDVVCAIDTCHPERPHSCALVLAPAPAPALSGPWKAVALAVLTLLGALRMRRRDESGA